MSEYIKAGTEYKTVLEEADIKFVPEWKGRIETYSAGDVVVYSSRAYKTFAQAMRGANGAFANISRLAPTLEPCEMQIIRSRSDFFTTEVVFLVRKEEKLRA